MGQDFLRQTSLYSTPPPPAANMFRGFQFAITLRYCLLKCVYAYLEGSENLWMFEQTDD